MINYCGVEFKNPMVIASSPLTSKIEFLMEAEKAGAAGVSTKLTFIKQPFYGKLRMHTYLNNGSIICYDRRHDIDESLKLIDEAKKKTSLKLFANITNDAKDEEGWVYLAKKHEEAGVDLIEANMICPNVGLSTRSIRGEEALSEHEHGGAVTGQSPERIKEIITILKSAVKIPVVAKLTPNVTDIGVTAKACEDAGADGVCVAGGQSSLPLVDIYNKGKPKYSLLKGVAHGSLGGPSTKLMDFSLVANIARKTSLPIIGGGGLETWQDSIMMMMWGADLVTVCTAAMWYGWENIKKQVDGMEKYLKEQGDISYSDIKGISLVHLRSSSDLEAAEGWAVVEEEKCIGCGRCEKPAHCTAVKIVNKKAVIDPKACIGCGICPALCPTKAISMYEAM